MRIQDIIGCLEEYAPLAYQEGYDNAGLLTGSLDNEVNGVLIAVDCTEEVVQEAIENNCNLIVAHHPILFGSLKKLTGRNYVERTIIKAIKNDVAIYASHTNLDNVHNGVNQKIADKLGVVKGKVLAPKADLLRKLVVYCPTDKATEVRDAIFSAGAGSIGNYTHCSFNSSGEGTFKGGASTNPHVGKKGELHLEPELKVETIYHHHLESKIIQAMLASHPYEEVAYDIYPVKNTTLQVGSGLVGELEQPMKTMDFLQMVKDTFNAGCLRYTNPVQDTISTVALCGGSGSFLLNDAIRQNADVFLSADFKYHQFFDADKKITIADIGHYEIEQCTMELIHDILIEKFHTFAFRFSQVKTNPVNYL